MMKRLRLIVEPCGGFGSPILGVSFFGQMCWAVLEMYGKERLSDLLEGYAEGKPYAVASDAFPSGYLPLPVLPRRFLYSGEISPNERKTVKSKHWLPVEAGNQPNTTWLDSALPDDKVGITAGYSTQTHNSISRLTCTTGEDQFAPYQTDVYYYGNKTLLDLIIDFDETRITDSEIKAIVEYIGLSGYGRDGSVGLGHYLVKDTELVSPFSARASFYLTLADCVPAKCNCNPKKSFYQSKVHFGRLGAQRAVQGHPFKHPVIMVKTGAVLNVSNEMELSTFIGQGISGTSSMFPDVVMQGYAPVVPLPKCEIV